ncbi:hypothetical protein [Mycobacterium sp. SMC-8]|uniref:hypothetical protein n=1 Tax=Mycobacterium sp. SMC-8 TaxID=2857060 RepID=UPI0037C8BC6B
MRRSSSRTWWCVHDQPAVVGRPSRGNEGDGVSTRTRSASLRSLRPQDDPALADGWLSRYATGERTVAVLIKLSENAERLERGFRPGSSLAPLIWAASFDIEYARFPVADQITAHPGLCIRADRVRTSSSRRAAHTRCACRPDHPETGYVRACLATKTQRWPDVLTAVGVCTQSPRDVYLARAASLLEAWASSQSGIDAACLTSRTAESLTGSRPPPMVWLRGEHASTMY